MTSSQEHQKRNFQQNKMKRASFRPFFYTMHTNAPFLEGNFDPNHSAVFPILGFALNKDNTEVLDFSKNNKALFAIDLSDTAQFNEFVFGSMIPNNKVAGAGGFFEHREVYARSEHFGGAEARCVHLGIDVWIKAGSLLFAPLDATIHSFGDNAGFGNYGPTLILQHNVGSLTFYSLYGHLSRADMNQWKKGKKFKAGEQIGTVGPYPENGDWPPHVHFQLMTEMLGWKGDFPGVCAPSQVDFYSQIVADPKLILGDYEADNA